MRVVELLPLTLRRLWSNSVLMRRIIRIILDFTVLQVKKLLLLLRKASSLTRI